MKHICLYLVAMLCIGYVSAMDVNAETVRDFNDPEGKMFEDYRYFPPALIAHAKKIFEAGAFKDTELYLFIKEEYGFQAAEDFRMWWIRSEIMKHNGY